MSAFAQTAEQFNRLLEKAKQAFPVEYQAWADGVAAQNDVFQYAHRTADKPVADEPTQGVE